MNSPYANPGGRFCMYCGAKHRVFVDCRLPCDLCQEPGVPYTLDTQKQVLCFEHSPSKDWQIQPCPAPKNVIFDMETQDPDDFLTLCWLTANPRIHLVGVTVTPGTQEQIALIRETLYQCNVPSLSIGSFDMTREDGCVSAFHYSVMPGPRKVPATDTGANVIRECLRQYPDATLLTGGPLKNLHKFLEIYPDMILQHWVAQGGFAGDSLVKPEHRLAKFAGRETCPTFNFNGDPQGAFLALNSQNILKKTLVSKNVCHSISYDQDFHKSFIVNDKARPGMKMIHKTMEAYLQRHPKGKMLHDPLAACVMMNPDICEFEEVEVYRIKGEWGSRKAQNTRTKISVSVDAMKFQKTFLLHGVV